MKRIIIYYSLSGNTEDAVKLIAEQLGCDTLRIDTEKQMRCIPTVLTERE